MNKTALIFILALSAVLLFAISACSQAPGVKKAKDSGAMKSAKLESQKSKRENIRRMLLLSGSAKLGIQVMREMLKYQQQANPKVPRKFWEDFMNEVNPGKLIDLIVPIYDRYFTHEDIKGMIRFYQSPVGKKLVSVQPMITRDSMAAGAQWGMAIGRKILQKLQEKGYR